MGKKIWIINQYNMSLRYGHLNRHFILASKFKDLGYEPILFVGSYLHNSKLNVITDNSQFKKEDDDGFTAYYIRTVKYFESKILRIIAMFQFYYRVNKMSKKLQSPDVIIGSSAHPLAALLAVRLAKKRRCKSIVEIRDLWPESLVAYNLLSKNNLVVKLMYKGEKWLYCKADQVVFTMEGGRDYIIDKKWDLNNGGKIDLSKIHHINNGVDIESFEYCKNHYKIFDKDLTNSTNFKVMYVGSIRSVNKVDKLVDVALEMKDENVMIIIYGTGNLESDLKRKISTLGLSNIILKGKVDKKLIPNIISNSNLNIHLGEQNTVFKYGLSANKLFDYLASAKPLLITFKSNYSIVSRFNCGLELDSSDTSEIVEGIRWFMRMSKLEYMDYCNNAKKASLEYDYKVLAKKYIDIIES